MAKLKTALTSLLIGLLFGLWGGINIGKQQPLYANPFSTQSLPDRLRDSGREVLRESGAALQRGGEAIEQLGGSEDQAAR